jgi:predicted CopG family antitoxin
MTTVTVSRETHRKLKQLKERENAGSFNELLDKIAEERMETPSTDEMFDSMELKDRDEVRDRNDRMDRYG